MTPSYATLAQRADRALEQVETTLECPICDQPVACTVYGTDVEIAKCADDCDGRPRREWLEDAALARAAGARLDYLNHLRDGGQ